MPFNVVDKEGYHLGVVARAYPGSLDFLLIALTEESIEEIGFDFNYLRDAVAAIMGCKSLTGKVKEDKFKDLLVDVIKSNDAGIKDLDLLIKYLYLTSQNPKGINNIEENLNIQLDEEKIKGYLMLDRKKIVLSGENILIDEEIDYIEEIKIPGTIPILCKIIDYPVIGTVDANITGTNHIHRTWLRIKSGNHISKGFDFPIGMNVKKDMNMQMYLDGEEIKRVFCDGVIYNINSVIKRMPV